MPARRTSAPRAKRAVPEKAVPKRRAPAKKATRARATPARRRRDPFGYDPRMHARMRPVLRFFYDRYWRVKVDGTEHLPAKGAALIVSNHSGAIPIDAAMLSAAMEFAVKPPRLLRFLFDRFVSDMPLVGDFYRKVGAVPASYENGLALLQQGDLVGIFPEGVAGVAKGYGQRYRLQDFRTGFVRMSIEARVPIIPVAVVGAEEAYPLIGKLERLGPLGSLLHVPYLPVTPLFPLLGPLGVIPLPSRWEIRFGPPIRFYDDLKHLRVSPRTSRLLAQDVRRQLQNMVHALLADRDSLFVGPR